MVAHRSTHSIFEPHVWLWASSKARAPLRHWPYPSHVVRGTSIYMQHGKEHLCPQPVHTCIRQTAHSARPCATRTTRYTRQKALCYPRLHTDHTQTAKKYTYMGRRDKKLTLTYQFWQAQNDTNPTIDKNCTLEMTKNCQPMPPKNTCHTFLCTASHFHVANTTIGKFAQRLHIDRQ